MIDNGEGTTHGVGSELGGDTAARAKASCRVANQTSYSAGLACLCICLDIVLQFLRRLRLGLYEGCAKDHWDDSSDGAPGV